MISIISGYRTADDLLLDDGAIPLTWWVVTPNFGDLLSPYLVQKLTGLPTKLVKNKVNRKWSIRKSNPSYLAIGSIVSRAKSESIVWGAGCFGTETREQLCQDAVYRAVRGPLTRNLLRIHDIQCPEVYGDPALLLPRVFNPEIKKKYKVGMILRWSEQDWNNVDADSEVLKIYLGTDDIESTLTEILQCERIVSSSLHGLILADAYGIPSAWLSSGTPKGLEFKFYDYFISVNKLRKPQRYDFSDGAITPEKIYQQMEFSDEAITFDEKGLLAACPFLMPV